MCSTKCIRQRPFLLSQARQRRRPSPLSHSPLYPRCPKVQATSPHFIPSIVHASRDANTFIDTLPLTITLSSASTMSVRPSRSTLLVVSTFCLFAFWFLYQDPPFNPSSRPFFRAARFPGELRAWIQEEDARYSLALQERKELVRKWGPAAKQIDPSVYLFLSPRACYADDRCTYDDHKLSLSWRVLYPLYARALHESRLRRSTTDRC